MALSIRDSEIEELAERLALKKRVSKTQAVREALRNEWERMQSTSSLWNQLEPLLDEIHQRPDRETRAAKGIFDEIEE